MEIVWSAASLRRVEEIATFIAKDSPAAASQFVEKLIHSVDRLAKHPLSGAIVPENMAFRQVVFKKYRVIYRLAAETIQIVTLISPGLQVVPVTKDLPKSMKASLKRSLHSTRKGSYTKPKKIV